MNNTDIFNSEWVSALNRAMEDYAGDPWTDTAGNVAAMLMRGIIENVSAPFPGRISFGPDGEPEMELAMSNNRRTGKSYSVLLSRPGEEYEMIFTMKLRSMLRTIIDDEELSGLVINPHSEEMFVLTKDFLRAAIELPVNDTGKKPKGYPERFREESGALYRIDSGRPMGRNSYKYAETILKTLRGSSAGLEIDFRNAVGDDAVNAVLMRRSLKGCRMALVYDMEDLGWDEPLVLENDMDLETALSILRRLGLKGEETGNISEIENEFKQVE